MNGTVPAKTASRQWWGPPYGALGVIGTIVLWQIISSLMENPQFSDAFSPWSTFLQLVHFVVDGPLLQHAVPSLFRVLTGLLIAVAAGIPLGVMIGYFPTLSRLTNTVFQFGRMTSPLAWMPIAIIAFGVGDRPVCFLVAIAAVWPIILSTAHGVRGVNPIWTRVVRMLGANQWGILRRAIVPAVIPDMLNGLRISIGVSWIVLVPAEMLGVSSGLGYYILDARDRFNYAELMAVILVIGFLGFASDSLVRAAQRQFSWRESDDVEAVV